MSGSVIKWIQDESLFGLHLDARMLIVSNQDGVNKLFQHVITKLECFRCVPNLFICYNLRALFFSAAAACDLDVICEALRALDNTKVGGDEFGAQISWHNGPRQRWRWFGQILGGEVVALVEVKILALTNS